MSLFMSLSAELHRKSNRRMSRVQFTLLLEVMTFQWTLTFSRGDTEVSCVFMESCILPCSFQSGADPVIHWFLETAGNLYVHSFYSNKDQLGLQDQFFRNRTSLFKDQISRGNASLQLTGVEVQDEDIYKCHTSTNRGSEDSLINLRVDAPVSKVNMEQVGNRIICSSEGIYPQPDLTWSTRPPSNLNLQNQTSIQQTEQQLYNISSSLILSDSETDLIYICTISTRSNSRRVTLFKTTSISVSDSETTISCTASNASITGFSLTWRFKHSQIILNQSRADISYTVSDEWRQQVKGVSESGSLMLQDLSSHHEGIYSCEVSDAEETLITNTFLRREKSQEKSTNVGAIIGGVVILVVAAAAVVFLVRHCKKKTGRWALQLSEPTEEDQDKKTHVGFESVEVKTLVTHSS